MADRPRCKGTRRDGEPCQAPATMGDWCPWHSPAVPAEIKESWAKLGGLRSRPAALPDSPVVRLRSGKECLSVLEAVATSVRRGELDCRIANSIAALIGVAARLVEVALLERRVAVLEKQYRPRRRR